MLEVDALSPNVDTGDGNPSGRVRSMPIKITKQEERGRARGDDLYIAEVTTSRGDMEIASAAELRIRKYAVPHGMQYIGKLGTLPRRPGLFIHFRCTKYRYVAKIIGPFLLAALARRRTKVPEQEPFTEACWLTLSFSLRSGCSHYGTSSSSANAINHDIPSTTRSPGRSCASGGGAGWQSMERGRSGLTRGGRRAAQDVVVVVEAKDSGATAGSG